MLLIPCPHCGPRHEAEFVNGGAVKARRPDDLSAIDDAQWVDMLTVPPNPQGPLREKWWHRSGCGAWFAVVRDTVTHDVSPDDGEPVAGAAEGARG
jgi:heterotetrameric sarcosine oxidase delta subunit